jgi:DNA-binding NarL/FixJ family response regulator
MEHISVSIVEDISEVRESIERLIQASDDFMLASSYSNAEAAIQDLPGVQPDIVIMDINLPGMSGIDCIRNIKEDCPSTVYHF